MDVKSMECGMKMSKNKSIRIEVIAEILGMKRP
jgi:hypothetical protein